MAGNSKPPPTWQGFARKSGDYLEKRRRATPARLRTPVPRSMSEEGSGVEETLRV